MRAAIALGLAAAMIVAPVAPAQQTGQPQNRTHAQQAGKNKQTGMIRAVTELVLIDAQVTDRTGKPIKGLKREQFSVSEDGKAQEISSFEYFDIEGIESAAAADQRPVVVSMAGAASPETIREQMHDRRLIVLFFDLTSLHPDELLRARDAALKFVKQQMTAADLVGAVAFGNRLGVLANFTNDKDALTQAIGRLAPGVESQLADLAAAPAQNGEADVSEDVGAAFTPDETEFNIFNTDRKLAAMEALANILRSVPGKKSVILFTGGITQTGDDNRTQLRAATDAANRSNVSFYTVDSRGLAAEIPGGDATTGAAAGTSMFSGASVFKQVDARQDSRDTLATLSTDTGGRAFFDLGNLNQAFDKIEQDNTGYYLLGYTSTNPARDGRWRSVRVRVNISGAHLRFREGYYAPRDYQHYTEEDREQQIEDAMRAETPRVELPIALETARFQLSDKQVFVPIAAKLSSSALQWAERRGRHEAEFDFAAEVRGAESGQAVAALRDTIKVRLEGERFEQVSQRALLYQGGVVLAPGNYRLKFLARENETGRIGTFEEDLELAAPQPDRLVLSTVLLSSQIVPVEKTAEVQKKALGAEAKLAHSPLEVAGERILPSVTRVFTRQQTLYVFFQAYYPAKADPAKLRAGIAFFRNGVRVSATPLVAAAETNVKARAASFRISLPLEKLPTGRYTVQAVAVDAGTQLAAFGRAYLALRAPAAASPTNPPSGQE
jgi:VWFA-related protein